MNTRLILVFYLGAQNRFSSAAQVKVDPAQNYEYYATDGTKESGTYGTWTSTDTDGFFRFFDLLAFCDPEILRVFYF